MTEKCWATLIIMVGSNTMIFVRRYNNKDENAGYYIAGWTIFILLSLWVF